jgi:class 3 adenylate cyclase/tetratricopeptide (TPR) repeat protein
MVRKTVTVVFVDLTDSTSLGESLDAEALRSVLDRYFDVVSGVIERHGGTVEKFIGDAVMAVFGIPVTHEDDALRALRAAVEIRTAVADLSGGLAPGLGVELAVCAGMATGEVATSADAAAQRLVTGDVVNVAARLQGEAKPGEILAARTTLRLARDRVEAGEPRTLTLRGKTEPVEAALVLGLPDRGGAERTSSRAAFVGRDRELALLKQSFERAVSGQTCQLFSLLGPAGVGKSRLASELLEGLGGQATVLRGSCLPYGEGITFWPVRKVVEQAAGIDETTSAPDARARILALVTGEDDAERIVTGVAAATGLADEPVPAEETFWAVRKLLESLAERRPVVVVLDDLDWAEPTLLDLIEHLADWSRGFPIFVLCLARPELLETRAGWSGGKLNALTTLLEPLSDDACRELLESTVGSGELAARLGERIFPVAEGNPLFVEEMLAMLIEDGSIRPAGDGWELGRELDTAPLPQTIHVLLQARLDRLGPDERSALERASVIGNVFSMRALRNLADGDVDVDPALETLVRKELLRPDRHAFAARDGFRFRHGLVRDAAYGGLSKSTRADLHERFGDWLGGDGAGPGRQYEEIVGYHLEQAHELRTDLGVSDPDLARRASDQLGTAGRRAAERGDMPAAANLLDRAATLLPREDSERGALLLDLAEALLDLGESGLAHATITEARTVGEALKHEQLVARASTDSVWLRVRLDPATVLEGRAELARAIDFFAASDDDRCLAHALSVQASLYASFELQVGAAQELLERALGHAEAAADVPMRTRILSALAAALFWGPVHAGEAIERCEEIVGQVGGDRRAVASVRARIAGLHAMRGNFPRARSDLADARVLLEELGLPFLLARTSEVAGLVELLAGDHERAAVELRAAADELERMGERAFRATTVALLARALAAQGEDEEAERWTHEAEDAAVGLDKATEVIALATRAGVLARRGELSEAEGLARRAVEAASASDELRGHADALWELGGVLRLSGDLHGAAAAIRSAHELYVRKGVAPLVERAGRLMAELPQPDASSAR